MEIYASKILIMVTLFASKSGPSYHPSVSSVSSYATTFHPLGTNLCTSIVQNKWRACNKKIFVYLIGIPNSEKSKKKLQHMGLEGDLNISYQFSSLFSSPTNPKIKHSIIKCKCVKKTHVQWATSILRLEVLSRLAVRRSPKGSHGSTTPSTLPTRESYYLGA